MFFAHFFIRRITFFPPTSIPASVRGKTSALDALHTIRELT